MFDKNKFAQILKKISDTYDNQRVFAEKTGVNRTYLSQYINLKLDDPPSPKILKKIAENSNGATSYYELMEICDYIDFKNLFYKTNDGNDTNSAYWYKVSLRDIGITLNDIKLLEKVIFDNTIKDKKGLIDEILYKYSDNIRTQFYNTVIGANKLVSDIKRDLKREHKLTKNPIIEGLKYYPCPVYGQISAGQPNWAEECLEGYLPLDPELMGIINPEEYYFLKVNGESMNKIVRNGAFALIHKQETVNNGEIAVVLVNGDEATLKRFSKERNIIVLTPESTDNSYTQQIYTKENDVKIIGKYVGKMEFNN